MRHTLPQQLRGGIHFCFSVFVCVFAVCNLLVVFMGFSQAERSESLCVCLQRAAQKHSEFSVAP